jgi:hypothetical protein
MGQKTEDVTWASIRSAGQWSPTQAQWVIAELERSGLGTKRFAARYKLGLPRIYYWHARFKAQGWPKQLPPGLVEVRVTQPTARSLTASPATPTRVEIELLSGRRLNVAESVDLDRLGELVTLLERS